MIELIGFGIGLILCIFTFLFAYLSSHIVQEEKKGENIPMFWEKYD